MSKYQENEIKCELPRWKQEKEMEAKVEAAQAAAEFYRGRFNKAKAVVIAAVLLIVTLAAVASARDRENTAATAAAAILTEYEKEFKAEAGTAERIEVAAEVERVFKGVDLADLPEKNAEFLEACRMITKQLGGNAHNEK